MRTLFRTSAARAQAAAAGSSWLPPPPAGWPQAVDYGRTKASEITRGVEQYAETYDTVAGRERIQVLTADLPDPNVRAGVVAAGDSVLDPADERTSSMAATHRRCCGRRRRLLRQPHAADDGDVMPVADLASHVWLSSDSRVASIDPVTGRLTAWRDGTVTVSVMSGGVVGSATVSVG